MAKIPLSEGFSVIPEGTYIFKITNVNYNEDFGKMEIQMQTSTGKKHTERFSLLTNSGEANQGALNAFSYFAKTAMNDFTLEDIDSDDLVGHYISCEVTHNVVESKNKPGTTTTFVNLGDKSPASGFDDDGSTKTDSKSKKSVDLDKLLG